MNDTNRIVLVEMTGYKKSKEYIYLRENIVADTTNFKIDKEGEWMRIYLQDESGVHFDIMFNEQTALTIAQEIIRQVTSSSQNSTEPTWTTAGSEPKGKLEPALSKQNNVSPMESWRRR